MNHLVMIEIDNLIALISLIVANGLAIGGVFLRLNIKIASLSRDYISLKNDIEEHKLSTKSDLKEFKDIVLRDKVDNRDDHQRMVNELNSINKSISDMRVDVIKAIKDKF